MFKMNNVFDELYSYMESIRVINTHSHHPEDKFFLDLDLEKILKTSYAEWCGVSFDNTLEKREDYLNRVRYNSYFIWLEKALQKIYQFDCPISSDNWDTISNTISEAYKQGNYHLDILQNECKYEKVILDNVWDSGSVNGHQDIFVPTYRVNVFLYGYSDKVVDRYGNNPKKLFNINTKDIDEYVALMENVIVERKQSGTVALKSIGAYERTLDYSVVSKDRASRVLKLDDHSRTKKDIKEFEDYIFFEICRIAAKYDLPIQCHTGLALLEKTNAMELNEVIKNNPDTKFVLFHGSYPWLEDIYALTHNYKNVYPDICWLPLVSPSSAERMVEELIEVSTVDRICWGCDSHSSEESMGALLAARFSIARALSKKVKCGYFSTGDAKKIIYNILYNNPKMLYKL